MRRSAPKVAHLAVHRGRDRRELLVEGRPAGILQQEPQQHESDIRVDGRRAWRALEGQLSDGRLELRAAARVLPEPGVRGQIGRAHV